jgi:hypothetical protein
MQETERNMRLPDVPGAGSRHTSRDRLRGHLRTWCYALIYILGFHYAYVAYINPTFEYAHYDYLSFSNSALLGTYVLALLPIIAYRSSLEPAQALVALIYTLAYVPIQLSLLFTVEGDYGKLFGTQILLAFSMMVLFHVAKGRKRHRHPSSLQFQPMDIFVGVATTLSLVLLVAANMNHMRLVSFEDVYDLRFEVATAFDSPFAGYLTTWLSYCFISYCYARGLVHRKWSLLFVGLISSVLLYMSTGAKEAILLLPITIGLGRLWNTGRDFLPRLLLTMGIILATIIFAVPDEGLGVWIKSIVLVRVVGTVGWVASKYLEYFTKEGLTYYSHVGPINALTDMYRYGDLSLGQVIGSAYSGSTDANFNGSFWASDGFAALGPVGVLVITPFVAGVLYVINRVMAGIDSKFAVLWMAGFFIALLNVPLSTALLSGGGLIIFAQAWWLSRKVPGRRTSAPVSFSAVPGLHPGQT